MWLVTVYGKRGDVTTLGISATPLEARSFAQGHVAKGAKKVVLDGPHKSLGKKA